MDVLKTTTQKERWLSALDQVKRADQAIHASMPLGGNAQHEEAQTILSQLIRFINDQVKEYK